MNYLNQLNVSRDELIEENKNLRLLLIKIQIMLEENESEINVENIKNIKSIIKQEISQS